MRLSPTSYNIFIIFILAGYLLSIDTAFFDNALAQFSNPAHRHSGGFPEGRGPDGVRGGFVSRLDRDADNRVSREEFDGPPDQFDIHDRNSDGFLTEEERPGLPPRGHRPPPPHYDEQVSPVLTTNEQQTTTVIPEARHSDRLQVGSGPDGVRGGFVSRLDRDGDDRVSREEFDVPPDQLDIHDRNNNSFLTEEERPGLLPRDHAPPFLSPDMLVSRALPPEVPQDPTVAPDKKEEPMTSPWLWMVIISVVAAFILALVWGLHSTRRLRQVKNAVESLDPHLLGVNIDNNIIITEVTEALCKATGFKYRDLVGKPLMALGNHTGDNPRVMQEMWNKIKRGIAWKGEVKLIRKNGSAIWADAVISPLRRKKETSSGYTVFYQDISKRKHFEELSMRDELTGLFNRRYFNEAAPLLLQKTRSERHAYVLCILDVDNFKAYNDTYGHPAGDRALAAIAKKLTSVFQRRDDMVFRLGGEEFGAIFIVNDSEEAIAIAKKTLKEIRNLRIDHEKNPLGIVTVSMGLKIVDANETDDIETIYKKADQVLYEAKQTGRDRFMVATS